MYSWWYFRNLSSRISLQLSNNPINNYWCLTFWIVIWSSVMLWLRLGASQHWGQGSSKQVLTEREHDYHARERLLVKGDSVLVRNFSSKDPWLPDVIYSKTGPASFTVDITNGRKVWRHLDYIWGRKLPPMLLTNHPLWLKLMIILLFRCRILQMLSHLQELFLQEQVKILNLDALSTLDVLPNIFLLTLTDAIVLEGGCCIHML